MKRDMSYKNVFERVHDKIEILISIYTNKYQEKSKMDMDAKEINHYDNCKYYSYDGELYTRTFPHEWAKHHLKNTGPKECVMCNKFGSWNGVFVAYCINCANEYRGKRGSGVYIYEKMCEINNYNQDAAFYTYLNGVDFAHIGDKGMLDSEEMYKITYTDVIDRELNVRILASFDYNNNTELPNS